MKGCGRDRESMDRMNRYQWGKWLTLAAGIDLLGSYMVTAMGHARWGNLGFLLGMAILLAAHIVLAKVWDRFSHSMILGCTVIFVFLVLFWDSSYLATEAETVNRFNFAAVGAVLHLCALMWIWILIRRFREFRVQKEDVLAVGCVLAVFVVLSLDTLDDWARWDSRCYVIYMQEARNFDFTLQSVKELNLVGHLALGYSVPALLFCNLIGDVTLACRIWNLVQAGIAISCFYGILSIWMPGAKRLVKTAGTAAFALSPWLLGMVGDASLDYASFCFLVPFVYFSLKKERVPQLLFGYMLCFSKEPGMILCFSYAAGCFLQAFRKSGEKNWGRRIWKSLWQMDCMIHAIPVLSWLGMYLVSTRWGAGDSFHYFGIVSSYMIPKLRAILFLNFNWLFWLVIVLGAVWAAVRRIRRGKRSVQQGVESRECRNHPADRRRNRQQAGEETASLVPAAVSMLGFLVFQLIFVTYNHPRYLQPLFFFLILFAVLILDRMLTKNSIKTWILGIAAVLLGIQSFVSVDPVAEHFSGFVRIDTGNGYVLSTNWIAPPDNYGDPIVYNRQCSYLDEALRKALGQMELGEETVIFLPSPYQGLDSYGYAQEYIFYNLLGDYHYSGSDMYWDGDEQLLTSDQAEGRIPVRFVLMNSENRESITEKNVVYYLSFPWIEDDEALLSAFDVETEETVTYRSCRIVVRKLQRRGMTVE